MPPLKLADDRIAALSQLWKAVLSEPPSQNLNELWKEHTRIRQVLGVSDDEEPFDLHRQYQVSERAECIEKLKEWLIQQQIDISTVSIRPVSYGFGLFAARDLAANTTPIAVPHNALLSLDYGAVCSPIREMHASDWLLSSMSNVSLAIIVAYVLLTHDEHFTPYINALPSTYHTPLFFTTNQLLSLKPSPAFESALLLFRAVARHYVYFVLRVVSDSVLKIAKKTNDVKFDFRRSPYNSDKFTFGLYRWCVCTVATRLNNIPSVTSKNADGSPTIIPALIPLVDFANFAHADADSAAMLFDASTNQVQLQLCGKVALDSEIFLNYGSRSNAEFLLHNGFVPQGQNSGNIYEIKFGIAKSADTLEKQHILKEKNIQPERGVYTFALTNHSAAAADPTELQLWQFAVVFVAASGEDLKSAETRAKARTFLIQRLQLLQRSYASLAPTEPEDDDLASRYIWRLKRSELELLKAHEALLESFKP